MGEPEGNFVGAPVRSLVGDEVRLLVGEPVGLVVFGTPVGALAGSFARDEVGLSVGVSVGDAVGAVVGVTVGKAVGFFVGAPIRSFVGYEVGVSVGSSVGDAVGEVVGVAVGEPVGVFVGTPVGESVGSLVGDIIGDVVGVTVGDVVGALVDVAVELSVGATVRDVVTRTVGAPVGTGGRVWPGEVRVPGSRLGPIGASVTAVGTGVGALTGCWLICPPVHHGGLFTASDNSQITVPSQSLPPGLITVREYMPGSASRSQPNPKETKAICLPSWLIRGPPESSWQVSPVPVRVPVHNRRSLLIGPMFIAMYASLHSV